MNDLELVVVGTARDPRIAEIKKTAIEQEFGINCGLENLRQSSYTGIFDIKILVPAEFADQAKAFLDSHDSE